MNALPETENLNIITYEYYYNGGGVAVLDINNDGLSDLYFTANYLPNKLYLNEGNFKFKDITKSAGVGGRRGWKTGVSVADVNGDGWVDIYVCYSGDLDSNLRANQLFINNKNNTFTDSAAELGVADKGYSTQAAFFDYDRDGDLDLFVLNHNVKDFRNFDAAFVKKTFDLYAGDQLYENIGNKFTNVTNYAGIIANPLGYGLGLAISDLDKDGYPDIYVSNDYVEEDYLYLNNKNKTFTESLKSKLGHISNFSMGIDVADIDNDGWNEIFTLDMLPETNERQKLLYTPDNYELYNNMLQNGFHHQLMRNMLHKNNGDGTFSEIGQLANIAGTDWSWSCLFVDLNMDGFKDLLVTNGYGRDITNRDFVKFYANERLRFLQGTQEKKYFETLISIKPNKQTNYLFENNQHLSFINQTFMWGFIDSQISNGAVYADLDNDGDLDLILNNLNNKASIYQNLTQENSPHKNILKISLSSNSLNTAAIGAKVSVYRNNKIYFLENYPVKGFQSSMLQPLFFYVADAIVDSIIIQWPNGLYSKLSTHLNLPQNLLIKQEESYLYPENNTVNTSQITLQPQTSKLIIHHTDQGINDYKIQPLIHSSLSQVGPKFIKADINKDGLDDFYFCSGFNNPKHIYLQTKNGQFIIDKNFNEPNKNFNDINGVFFDADNDGDLDLYIVCGGYTFIDSTALQDRFYENVNGKFIYRKNNIPQEHFAGSVAVIGDFNNDGNLDIFVGSRLTPNNYPLVPQSMILWNKGTGTFVMDESNKKNLFMGMITDAFWGKISLDSKPKLIVCGEWMPIKLYEFDNSILVDKTSQFFTENLYGWWNKISFADLDKDGDLDFIAGNWGLNSVFKANSAEPLKLYFGDLDNNSSIDPLYTYFIQGQQFPMASRDELTDQLTYLRQQFPTYQSYSKATLNDIINENQWTQIDSLHIECLETVWFENKNDKFELQRLPVEANLAPTQAIAVYDFNADGNLDILIAGNKFDNRLKIGRLDAQKGTILLNTGNQNFLPLPANLKNFYWDNMVQDLQIFSGEKNPILGVGIHNSNVQFYQLKK
ncbi:MAG: VCBS repeat-containing protein [Sediminibacterium sp.]|nr:VCBS repeat-containing protein [Sediminibacterium sp.]